MPEQQTLTHSRLSCFRACPRKHYMKYELGIAPEIDGFALRVGSAFHHALDMMEKGQDVDTVLEMAVKDPYDLALVAAMVHGHIERWRSAPLETIESEQVFGLPLHNPATGASSRVWQLAGIVDKIVQLDDGRLALMEHKTTSRDFSPGADYWIQLHMDQQLSIYVIAARELGFDVETILYDVTRRPMMRPLKATPEENRKYKKDGELYANLRDVDETPAEFAARVAGDIASRPEHYFVRIEIARLDQDLEACASELWQQQLSIRTAQRLGHWYRSPSSCFAPWPCEYLPVCMNQDLENVTPSGFVRRPKVHPELARVLNGH